MRVSFHTLGCRLNFSESATISHEFLKRGHSIVPFEEPADLVFLNTCTVTDSADSTCRNLIRKAHRISPEAKIVVAGCYAQMEAEKIAKMEGVDLVLGNSEKYKVFNYLEEDSDEVIKIDRTNDFWGAATTAADSHTRAFLKIQDGCNYICSYCIIPFARGRSRAISIKEAIKEANTLVQDGFKEIVLTGVNIGEYEHTSGEKLSTLVQKLLEVKGLLRLRLSSVEPNTVTDELLAVLKDSEKAMDHFHIPLQSGCDRILTEMKRKYSTSDYANVVERIKKIFPNAGIGADMIVGFPGESDAEFQTTYKFVKELPITHFHVFPFSKRKNTVAAKMENHIQHGVKKDRATALNFLGASKLAEFATAQIGTRNRVLFEKDNEGYTTNFVRVKVNSDIDLNNQVREVLLTDSFGEELNGTLNLF